MRHIICDQSAAESVDPTMQRHIPCKRRKLPTGLSDSTIAHEMESSLNT